MSGSGYAIGPGRSQSRGVGTGDTGAACGAACAKARAEPIAPPTTVVRKNRLSMSAALEVLRVLRVALPLVVRVLGIRAEGPAPSWERAPRGRHGIGRRPLLDPVHDGCQQIERVQRRRATLAVAHPGRQEETAEVGGLCRAAVRAGHALVVVHRIERREPRVADA